MPGCMPKWLENAQSRLCTTSPWTQFFKYDSMLDYASSSHPLGKGVLVRYKSRLWLLPRLVVPSSEKFTM